MAPKPKNVPSRLGPPPQLARITLVQQQEKFQPKMREILAKNAKMLARWAHEKMTWKKLLMSWMVILVASKMVLLMLTYKFFTLTSLISLQTFHGVWTIAFFCLTVIETGAILPNASCLLAGYLPATTVLHILLIPNNYPLEYIITDAVGTFLAIITMFLLLRMECTEILHEAEELWIRQGSDTSSEAGSSTTGGSDISDTASQRSHRSALATALAKQNGSLHGHHVGPTIITVNGVSASINGAHNLDSMLYSMDEPRTGPNEAQGPNNVLFDEAIDLEPIDFEHFVDEPDLDGGQANSERVFKVSFGSSPPMRGR
jgi:hypothetical protein